MIEFYTFIESCLWRARSIARAPAVTMITLVMIRMRMCVNARERPDQHTPDGSTAPLEGPMRTALFSIAMAGALMAGALTGNAADYGLPPDVAKTALARCAKAFESLTARDTCMQNEAKAYNRLHGAERADTVRYSVADEERKARIRNESGYRDPPGTRQLR
jgi:hypothetical protein